MLGTESLAMGDSEYLVFLKKIFDISLNTVFGIYILYIKQYFYLIGCVLSC